MAKLSAITSLLVILLVASASAKDVDQPCKHIVGYEYFDLTDLFHDNDAHNDLVISLDSGDNIVLNMCDNQETISCGSNSDSFAVLQDSDDSCASVLTKDSDSDYESTKWRSLESDDESKGAKVTYTTGGTCSSSTALLADSDSDEAAGNKLIVSLQCDRSASEPVTTGTVSGCQYNVTIASKHACPTFNEDAVSTFVAQYSYVFGTFLCIFGFFLLLRGNSKFKWTIGIIGFLTTVVIVGSLGYKYIINPDPDTAPEAGWIIWGIAAVLGIGVGFLLGRVYKAALFLLGGWLGVVLALFMQPIFLYKIDLGTPNLALYLAMVILGIALGFAALYWEEHMKIIATSILGAYAFARGLSCFLGGFPPETQLAKMIEAGDLQTVPYTIYLYFCLFSVLSVVGLFTQYRHKEREEEQEHYKAL